MFPEGSVTPRFYCNQVLIQVLIQVFTSKLVSLEEDVVELSGLMTSNILLQPNNSVACSTHRNNKIIKNKNSNIRTYKLLRIMREQVTN